MPQRNCGTCRDRRILCDRAIPTCVQCAKSGRICKGYGLRLSWPNGQDCRRTMVGKPPRTRNVSRRISETLLVNASSWDIEMHYHLLGLVSDSKLHHDIFTIKERVRRDCRVVEYTKLVLQAPMPFNPSNLGVEDTYLFGYFQSTASRSLTTLGHDPTSIGKLLVRMALTNSSPSSTAVLRSLLALSSLHLHGLQSQAGDLKLSALKALTVASGVAVGPVEAAQHVAAGMLLCSFEIHRASCTSGEWACYVSGVKKIISVSSSSFSARDSDFNVLLDWVRYHDVLSRFSQLHWYSGRKTATANICVSEYPWIRTMPSTVSSLDATIQLLSGIFGTVAARPDRAAPAEDWRQYKAYVKILAWSIENILIPSPGENGDISLEYVKGGRLLQLSMLVYLGRATGSLLEPEYLIEQRIREGLNLMSQLTTCERQFPLFIIGCEARTDDERCAVLELIARTEESASSRSLYLVKRLIKAIWVQDDLANGELNYMDKLSAIISCCTILPTFV